MNGRIDDEKSPARRLAALLLSLWERWHKVDADYADVRAAIQHYVDREILDASINEMLAAEKKPRGYLTERIGQLTTQLMAVNDEIKKIQDQLNPPYRSKGFKGPKESKGK